MNTFTMDRRHFLGGTLGALLVGCGGSDSETDRNLDFALSRLDELTADLMARSGVPGVAVAVVRGDEKLYAKGFGRRDLRSSDLVDADTVFQLASMSKAVGATVVAGEVGRRQIRWDQHMQELLPWFALSDAQASQVLTLADLYAHRTGLQEHIGDLLEEEMGYDQREVLERLRYAPIEGFRQRFAYTNFGITAAGVAVAAHAGLDWAALSEQRLYQPLGMRRTSSRFDDFMQRDNRVTGHRWINHEWRVHPLRMPDAQGPAASVTSSVNDLAKWLSLLLGEGAFAGQRIVEQAALAPAVSPQMASPGRPTSHYGYGFNVGTTSAGHRIYGHGGAFLHGTSTSCTVLPWANIAIVALTNGSPVGLPESLCAEFVDLIEYGAKQDIDYLDAFKPVVEGMNRPQGSLVGVSPPASPAAPAPLSAYAGRYRNDFYGPLQVDVVDGALQLTLGATPLRLPLRHWGGDVFTFTPKVFPAGSISQASFADQQVTLELYDDDRGLATFVR